MTIDEKTRLDLRNKFEELIGAELADTVMEAMPNLDYDQLATKSDVDNVRIDLRGEMAELRGDLRSEMAELRGEMAELRGDLRSEMAELHGDLRSEMATNMRTMVLTQLGTSVALAGFVAGVA